jgi:hypothetical protein
MMAGSSDGSETTKTNRLSPELVQKVADKVYALWLRDLQIERERQRMALSPQNWSKRR